MPNEGLPTVERCPAAPAARVDALQGACLAAPSPPSNPATDMLFLALLQGFRRHGGLLGLRELLMTRQALWRPGTVAALPAALAERQVLGVVWSDAVWVPAFQFDAAGNVLPAAAAVHAELVPVFDPCELAHWWISPSCWLHGRSPIDRLGAAAAMVHEAARVDRYVAAGH